MGELIDFTQARKVRDYNRFVDQLINSKVGYSEIINILAQQYDEGKLGMSLSITNSELPNRQAIWIRSDYPDCISSAIPRPQPWFAVVQFDVKPEEEIEHQRLNAVRFDDPHAFCDYIDLKNLLTVIHGAEAMVSPWVSMIANIICHLPAYDAIMYVSSGVDAKGGLVFNYVYTDRNVVVTIDFNWQALQDYHDLVKAHLNSIKDVPKDG